MRSATTITGGKVLEVHAGWQSDNENSADHVSRDVNHP